MLSQELTECLHWQLYTLSCWRWYFDIFLQTPWRRGWIWRNPLVMSCQCNGKGKKESSRRRRLKWNENKNSLLEQFSLCLLHILKCVAPLKWPLSHFEYFQRNFAVTAVKLRTIYSRKYQLELCKVTIYSLVENLFETVESYCHSNNQVEHYKGILLCHILGC